MIDIVQRSMDALRSLIHDYQVQTHTAYHVANFPYANLNQEDLDELIADLSDLDI
jgi:hypothetical protein